MNKKIKLAAINSSYLAIPEEANPYSETFKPQASYQYVNENIEATVRFLHEAGRNGSDLHKICRKGSS